MKLLLDRLKEIHPRLPASTAAGHAHCAALALQRRHAPGIVATVMLDGKSHDATLHWDVRCPEDAFQLDRQRITEDGAEAVALTLVHEVREWIVVRRLQRGEHADWLLREAKTRRLVALEISGTDSQDGRARMTMKLSQVAQSRAARLRAACVVGFEEPSAALEMAPEAP